MKDFSPNNLLIPLVTALALYLPLSANVSKTPENNAPNPAAVEQPADTTKGKGSPPDRPDDKTANQNNATDLVCRFFGKPKPCNRQTLRDEIAGPGVPAYVFESMIVAVPDPKDSRFGYLFDRNLDAIQRALEAAGYLLDRFDFPWHDSASRTTPDSYETAKVETVNGKKTKNTQEKVQISLATPRYQREPGVVLFRSGGTTAKKKLLVLFLVGEMPTTGVHPEVLANALRQAAFWYCDSPSKKTPCQGRLRLLAPFFSGSQDSWNIALQNWKSSGEVQLPYEMISGSAMSVTHNNFPPLQPGSFRSTALPLSFAIKTMMAYLNDLEGGKLNKENVSKVAFLMEGNTAFGQSAAKLKETSTGKASATFSPSPLPSPGCSPTPMPRLALTPIPTPTPATPLTLPFPLHISQLRTATEKAKSSQTTAPMEVPGVRRPLLPLLLEDTGETKDVLPLYSQLEVTSAELVLSSTLNEINREHIRYVGIVATDVKDIIFLVGQIRRHCPNAVPFVFLSDMLYLHPEVNPELRGTLIAATYPLFAPNQLWTAPFPGSPNSNQNDRLQFPSQIAQGVYNATLALLGEQKLMREYGSPFDLIVQCQAPVQRQPPLWISIVGAHNLWPVRLVEFKETYTYTATAEATQAPFPLAISLVSFDGKLTLTILLMLIVGSFLVAFVTLTELVRAKWEAAIWWQKQTAEVDKGKWNFVRFIRFVDHSWFGKAFGDPVFCEANQLERRFYLLVCCASLCAALLTAMWVACIPQWVEYQLARKVIWEREHEWVRWVLAFLLAAIFPTTVWLLHSVVLGSLGRLKPDWLSFRQWFDGQRIVTKMRRQAIVKAFDRCRQILLSAWQRFKWRTSRMHTIRIGLCIALPSAFILWLALRALNRNVEEHLFFFLRARDFTNGISPLLPLLLVAVAMFLWAFCEIRRMMLCERLFNPDRIEEYNAPCHLRFEYEGNRSFGGYEHLEYSVSKILFRPLYKIPGFAVVLLLLLLPTVFIWRRALPSIEGADFDMIFKLSFSTVSLCLCFTFLRFVHLWITLRRLLRRFSYSPFLTHPLSHGDKERFPNLPKLSLTKSAASYAPLAYSVQQAQRLYRQLPELSSLKEPLEKAAEAFQKGLKAKAKGDWREDLRQHTVAQEKLSAFSLEVAKQLEKAGWFIDLSVEVPADTATPDWVKDAELYLVSRLTAFLTLVLEHFQSLALFVTTSMILLLMAITSYPFQPRELLLMFGWILIVVIVALTLLIFTQMSRDKVLSELSGTTPDKLSWDGSLFFKLALHGLLPILALLGAQFPDVFRQWFSWLSALQGGGQ